MDFLKLKMTDNILEFIHLFLFSRYSADVGLYVCVYEEINYFPSILLQTLISNENQMSRRSLYGIKNTPSN